MYYILKRCCTKEERIENESSIEDLQSNHVTFRPDIYLLNGCEADEFREIMESMLEGLGVATIWYDEHRELPGILNDLIENDKN